MPWEYRPIIEGLKRILEAQNVEVGRTKRVEVTMMVDVEVDKPVSGGTVALDMVREFDAVVGKASYIPDAELMCVRLTWYPAGAPWPR